jgi:hypothetical protein
VPISFLKYKEKQQLNSETPWHRKTILVAGASLCLFSIIALTLGFKTNSQQPQVLSKNNKDSLIRYVENSQDLPLRVAENDDCPLRIVQATVKEIPGSDFSMLTGRTTDLVTVSSVPEVKLLNTSGETITGFVVVVREPQLRITRGFVQEKISIDPGESYLIKRQHFVKSEKTTIASANGPARQSTVLPGLDSEEYWLKFGGSDVFVTIGKVTFKSGSSWLIKEGSEVR